MCNRLIDGMCFWRPGVSLWKKILFFIWIFATIVGFTLAMVNNWVWVPYICFLSLFGLCGAQFILCDLELDEGDGSNRYPVAFVA